MIYVEKLGRNAPHRLTFNPPWVPLTTYAAANFLRVHQKTLLEWSKSGQGPQPLPKGQTLGNQLYWLPGELLAWWESLVLPSGTGRSYQQICDNWKQENKVIHDMNLNWRMPPIPRPKHIRRRRRDLRRKGACANLLSSDTEKGDEISNAQAHVHNENDMHILTLGCDKH